jgi:hypothetical protein
MSEFLSQIMKQIGTKDLSNLDFDGKKLKWRNDYEQLQIFVQDRLSIKGKWSCPGGGAKRFKAKDGEFILNWYFKKQSTLQFQGTEGVNFKSKLTEQLGKAKHAIDHVESNDPAKNQTEDEAGPTSVNDENVEGEVNLADISLEIVRNSTRKSTNSHIKTLLAIANHFQPR